MEEVLPTLRNTDVDSGACVQVGSNLSEWFLVNIGFRQGCMMSPLLFNVYMDGVV